jgi:phosphatidylserine/phosphatidylglycerophosphate/cardiolipin synthase-like enzyme
MQSHIGVGIGKYIEEEFLKSKTSIMISSPIITPKFAKSLIELAEKGIHIKIVTSPRIDEESERANMMLSKFSNEKNNNQLQKKLELKIIDNKKFPMNHAKIYLIDNKTAIIGSLNLAEVHFWKYIEYLWIMDEPEFVNQVKDDFQKLWTSFSYITMDSNEKKVQTKNFIRKIRRKL